LSNFESIPFPAGAFIRPSPTRSADTTREREKEWESCTLQAHSAVTSFYFSENDNGKELDYPESLTPKLPNLLTRYYMIDDKTHSSHPQRGSPHRSVRACHSISPAASASLVHSSRSTFPSRSSGLEDFPKHYIESFELKMIRYTSDDLAHLLLNLRLVDSSFLCRFNRKSKHCQNGERDLCLLRRERSRKLVCESADSRRLSVTWRRVVGRTAAITARESKQDLDDYTTQH